MARREEFGRWLIGRLVEIQMSKADLARLVGVSGPAVHNWCNGTQPGSNLIVPLAEALRVEPEEIARVTGHSVGVVDVAPQSDLRADYERWVAQGIDLLARIGRATAG